MDHVPAGRPTNRAHQRPAAVPSAVLRAVGAAYVAVGATLAIYEARLLIAPDALGSDGAWKVVYNVALLVVSALGLLRATRAVERLPWLLVGLGVLAWSLGDLYFTVVLADADVIPYPSPADAGYLLFPPLLLAGALTLLRARTHDVPQTRWADGAIAALAVAAVCAAMVIQPILAAGDGDAATLVFTLVNPLADVVLLAVIVGILAGTGWRFDRTWVLLAAGTACFWLADSLFLLETARGTYAFPSSFDVGWCVGLALVTLAGWQPRAAVPIRAPGERLRLIIVPLVFACVGLAVLVHAALVGSNALAVACATGSLLAVMVRLSLTFTENVGLLRFSRDEAATDALIGLGNRRALLADLEGVLDTASGEPSSHLFVLCDLDGFKAYNDTFGHPAGDALLARLGSRLADHVAGAGRAYRMGGDEFCVLLRAEPPSALARVAAVVEALEERGEGFAVSSSSGAVLLPDETASVLDALRIADQRMYAQKHAGRASAGRQTTDALLCALDEHAPELAAHLAGVATMAAATATQLGLPQSDVERVRRAGELHDIGKIGIPEAILAKPGPLDAEEWTFVRRHTLIGERIIAAAPALASVALIVRSSHERWDGRGYPDGLSGDAIPLGARIVAVADAVDALTSDRPYARARPVEAALAEVSRCSGTFFDPAVVDAYRRAHAARPAATRI